MAQHYLKSKLVMVGKPFHLFSSVTKKVFCIMSIKNDDLLWIWLSKLWYWKTHEISQEGGTYLPCDCPWWVISMADRNVLRTWPGHCLRTEALHLKLSDTEMASCTTKAAACQGSYENDCSHGLQPGSAAAAIIKDSYFFRIWRTTFPSSLILCWTRQ